MEFVKSIILTKSYYYVLICTLITLQVKCQTQKSHISTHELFEDLGYPAIEYLQESKWHGFWNKQWDGYNFNHKEYDKKKLPPNECQINEGILDCSALPPSVKIIEIIGNTELVKVASNSFPKENNIEVLRLISLKGLTHVDDEIFIYLPKLQELLISGTDIERSPKFQNSMEFLELIDLYDNKITSIFEEAFKKCPSLIQVNLGQNLLTFMAPSAFIGTKTEYVTLHHNLFEYVPHLKGIESTLKYLGLEYNKIKTVGKFSLYGFQSLLHLNISYNPVNTFEHDCFQSLPNLQFLELISLSGNAEVPFNLLDGAKKLLHVTFDHSNALVFTGKSVEITPALLGFSARYCGIKGLDFRAIEGDNSLTRIWLDGNAFNSFQHSMFIHGKFESLKKLFLNDNNIQDIQWFSNDEFTDRTQIIIKHFQYVNQTSFSLLPQLTLLNLEGNQIARIRNNTFVSLDNLQELYMSRNRLTNIYVENNAFDGLNELKLLMLEDNNLNSVPPAVYSLKSLENFSMKGNKLNFILANDFTELTKLKMVNLDNNRIIFVENGAFPSSLQELNMAQNKFDFVDVEIFHSLAKLVLIKLSHNRITALPKDIFSLNINLESVYLDNNFLRFINSSHFRNCKLNGDIHLNHNQIAFIDENSFNHVTEIRNILLNNNELYQLPNDGMFQNIKVRDKIRVDNNRLTHIRSYTFSEISCRLFRIDNNDIVEIESFAFNEITVSSGDNKMVNIFDVSYNSIMYIHEYAFNKISVQKTAIFTYLNPLKKIPSFAFNEFSADSMEFNNNQLDIIETNGFHDIDIKSGLFLNDIALKWINRNAITGSVRDLYLDNNMITRIPGGALFHVTNNHELHLNNNRIEVIESNALPNTDDVINLENNQISLLTERMFGNNENTKTLLIQLNQIIRSEDNTFTGMPNLNELDLSYNKLTEIRDDLLSGLESLSVLNLKENMIRHFGAQNEISSLKSLDLSNNKLVRLDSTLFDSAVDLETLDLNNNSLSCGCGLFYALELAKHTVVGAACSNPAHLIDVQLNWKDNNNPRYFLNIQYDDIICEPVDITVKKIDNMSFKLSWEPPQVLEFRGTQDTDYCFDAGCTLTHISYDAFCENINGDVVFSIQDLDTSFVVITHNTNIPYFCYVKLNLFSSSEVKFSSFSQVVSYGFDVPPIDDLTCQDGNNCYVLTADFFKISRDVELFNTYGPAEMVSSPQYKRNLLVNYLYKDDYLDQSDIFVNWYGPVESENILTKGSLTLPVKVTNGYRLYAERFYPVTDSFDQFPRDCDYNVRPLGFTAKLSTSISRTQSEVLKLGFVDEGWVYVGGKLIVELIADDSTQEDACAEIRLFNDYAHTWIGVMSNNECQVSNFLVFKVNEIGGVKSLVAAYNLTFFEIVSDGLFKSPNN